MLDDRLEKDPYQNGLVSATAVLGIDVGRTAKESTWCTALDYTPKLSAIIKLARMMVVLDVYENDPEEDYFISQIRQAVERFMITKNPSPMYWIFELRTYGLKIRYTTTAAGVINWNGDVVDYQGEKFSMQQFRTMVHGLNERCRQVITRQLMLYEDEAPELDIPNIPWDSLADNPAERMPGYNFTQDSRNSMPVNGQEWLFNRLFHHTEIRDQFMDIDDHGTIRWTQRRVKQYMQAIQTFKEMLAVLIHITDGQPGRAPELLSTRYENTRNGGVRNIYIENGLVVLVAAYHKGYHINGSIKIIHRYLPREVGELLVWYLWLIEPFQSQLEVAVYGRQCSQGYLWQKGIGDRQWTSERFKTLLAQEFMKGIGVKMNISAYRHVAIAMARRYLRKDQFINDQDDEEGLEDGDEEDGPGMAIDNVYDLQAGHSSQVAGMVYGRGLLEGAGAVGQIRYQYRMVSEAWHRFLHFPSALQGPKRRREWEVESVAQRFKKWKQIQQVNPMDQLHRLIGPQAQFRGIQEPVLQAIMAGQSPILAVMGTGGGKSLLFMLPAMCSMAYAGNGLPGMTVVVIPMISLRQDLRGRCEAAGISCTEWEYRRPRSDVSIMLITPESAISKGFQGFLTRMGATHQLERIVIDECHCVLDSSGDFRPKLQRLSELYVAECQVVMLTATLPPCEQGQFFHIMGLSREQVKIFRSRTSRANIRYQVHDGGNSDKDVQEMVQQQLQQYPEGKIIVYSRSVKRVEQLAARLECAAYFRKVEGKKEVFEEFNRPHCPVIVATNALGLGIDNPKVRVVIHAEGPRNLRDFAQESGRAGRDGRVSESVVMMAEGYQHGQERMQQYLKGSECRRVILDGYLDGQDDRVQCVEGEQACDVCAGVNSSSPWQADADMAIGGGDDLSPKDADREEAFIRQRCERQWQAQQQLRESIQGSRSEEAYAVEGFMQKLDEWTGRCPICYTYGVRGVGMDHRILACPMEGVEVMQEEFRRMKAGIRYSKYSVCFECGVPQAICQRWESNDSGGWKRSGKQVCQYAETVIGGVAAVLVRNPNGVREIVIQWMINSGVDVQQSDEVYRWMGQKI